MKKLFAILLTLVAAVALVACKEDEKLPETQLSQEEVIANLISGLDYEEIFNDKINTTALLSVPSILTPITEENPVGLLLENIEVKMDIVANLKDIDSAVFNAVFEISIETISLVVDGEVGEPWITNTQVVYTLVYENGNLFSDLFTRLYFSEDYYNTINEFLGGFMGFMISAMIPAEYLEIYNLIVSMLVDHKEVMHIGQNETIFLQLRKMMLDMLKNNIGYITKDLIIESPLAIELSNEGLIFTKKSGITEIFDTLELKLKIKENKFDGLTGLAKLPLGENEFISASFNFEVNSNKDTLTIDIEEYEQVKIFSFIKAYFK